MRLPLRAGRGHAGDDQAEGGGAIWAVQAGQSQGFVNAKLSDCGECQRFDANRTRVGKDQASDVDFDKAGLGVSVKTSTGLGGRNFGRARLQLRGITLRERLDFGQFDIMTATLAGIRTRRAPGRIWHSGPSCSNDSPFSESTFGTLKYRPDMPLKRIPPPNPTYRVKP